MTLTASGTITLAAIRNEFKAASGAISLSEMYRSGTYVPPLTANAGIPTSGAIQMDDFYSSTISTDMDTSYVSEYSQIKSGGSYAGVLVRNNGDFTSSGTATPISIFIDTWVASSAAPGNWYEVYVSLTSGTTPSGPALNTWHAITTDREWTVSTGQSCVLSLKIRHKYITSSEETTTVTLTANA